MNKYKIAVLAGFLTGIVGCGGGGGGGKGGPDSIVATGKVIDGYIVGATVFLDLNFNGVIDENEPSSITTEKGDYKLTIPERFNQCAKYVPTVVDVPKGAVDMDSPNTPIEEGYNMVFPPQFALANDQDLLNLTPITTIVWQVVKQDLGASITNKLSCESIVDEQELREDIANRLSEQELRIARRYNITVDELYSDYVVTGNSELHQIAKDIIPSLQKSYKDTKLIADKNPDADIAWVEYFSGKWDSTSKSYDDKWYRQEFIQSSNGNFKSETYLVSDDLDTKVTLFDKVVMSTVQRDGVNVETVTSLEKVSDYYNCSHSEWLETLSSQSSGVRNTFAADVSDWDSCWNLDSGTLVQSLVTKNWNGTDLVGYTEHTYPDGYDSGFTHLIDSNRTISQAELSSIRQAINTDFYSNDAHNAGYWLRVKNVFNLNKDKPSQVMISHDSDGIWIRETSYNDGTHKVECGTSEENLSSEKCS